MDAQDSVVGLRRERPHYREQTRYREQDRRREQIRRRVLADGFSRVDDLAGEFDVSVMTLHRDLDALEADGWVTKVRGGAAPNPSALPGARVGERTAAARSEKRAIGAAAAEMVTRGQTIFLDHSTTALAVIPHLVSRAPVTVATNFLPAVRALAEVEGVELQLLGGQYDLGQDAVFGAHTVEAIQRLHADWCFLSTTAIVDGKCMQQGESAVTVRQALMQNADRRVLLVDHAKFGRRAPHMLCPVESFDVVVTDYGIAPSAVTELRDKGVDVQVTSAPFN